MKTLIITITKATQILTIQIQSLRVIQSIIHILTQITKALVTAVNIKISLLML